MVTFLTEWISENIQLPQLFIEYIFIQYSLNEHKNKNTLNIEQNFDQCFWNPVMG